MLPHARQSGETLISVSAGHIILTPTQPVGSGRPQRESNQRPPQQKSRAPLTQLLRPWSGGHVFDSRIYWSDISLNIMRPAEIEAIISPLCLCIADVINVRHQFSDPSWRQSSCWRWATGGRGSSVGRARDSWLGVLGSISAVAARYEFFIRNFVITKSWFLVVVESAMPLEQGRVTFLIVKPL